MTEPNFRALCAEVVDHATELADLMQGVLDGDYAPDCFTLQPIKGSIDRTRTALAQLEPEGVALFHWRNLGDGKPVQVRECPMCGIAPANVDDCGRFGDPACPYFGVGEPEPDGVTDEEIEREALKYADSDDGYRAFKSGAFFVQERISRPAIEPEGLPPRVGHILRLAEIIREVDSNHDKGAAALAEAILAHSAAINAQPAPVPVAERFEFSVFNSEYEEQAGGTAPTYAEAFSYGQHYLSRYSQDGPHSLEIRRVEVLPHHAMPVPYAEGAGLSDEEVLGLADDCGLEKQEITIWDGESRTVDHGWECTDAQLVTFATAVLTRYAHPTIEPVPVAERLPGPEDCNDEGEVWVEEGGIKEQFFDEYEWIPHAWVLREYSTSDELRRARWYPHNALPAPGAEVG